MLNQCRLAERRGLLTGRNLNEVQVFALELLMYQEWLDTQNANGAILKMRQNLADGVYDNQEADEEVDAEDYEQVQWESPSDNEAVMKEIEMFNETMAANAHVVVDDGGEWI